MRKTKTRKRVSKPKPKRDSLTLLQLMELANSGYEDGYLANYYDKNTGMPKRRMERGDTLAKFIVMELAETFDPNASRNEQIYEAHRVLYNAKDDLDGVINALLD